MVGVCKWCASIDEDWKKKRKGYDALAGKKTYNHVHILKGFYTQLCSTIIGPKSKDR